MPRDLPLSNGTLLVAFDCDYRPRDVYFPHVGSENHTAGKPMRLGVWADGRFAWVDKQGWELSLDYLPDTLVTDVRAHNADLGLTLECNDAVDFHTNAFVRRITVHNHEARQRDVRLFFSHDFNIFGNSIADTAYYDPDTFSIIHYKGERWFLISGCDQRSCGIDQFATGKKEFNGAEGTWRDAEDGELQGNPVSQGSVDSTVALWLDVPAGGSGTAHYWMVAGQSYREVADLHRLVSSKTPQTLIDRTEDYWRLWVNKEELQFCGLPDECARLFKRSMLVIRTQIDQDGGVLAANDSDITHHSSDTYSYVWPRDGAMVASALREAGYHHLCEGFFNFCGRVVEREGYLLHKYTPEGMLASTWHPRYVQGHRQLPIQEDETALVIWALWRHFDTFRDIEFVKPLYRRLVIRGAEFLESYRNPDTGLPRPSWDLWEERWGVHSFTCGAVYGGLAGAAGFAAAFGESDLSERFTAAADGIREAMGQHLYHAQARRFARAAYETPEGLTLDMTLDSSLTGLYEFGAFAPDDERVVATLEAVRAGLRVQTEVGGIARYENDQYQRPDGTPASIPGNPWFVSTLGLAAWDIARAQTREDLEAVVPVLKWVADRALPSGVLAEQLNPLTGEALSVSPLTWSHSAYVKTVMDWVLALRRFEVCDACGAPLSAVRRAGRAELR